MRTTISVHVDNDDQIAYHKLEGSAYVLLTIGDVDLYLQSSVKAGEIKWAADLTERLLKEAGR